jgi:hypothetical protein
VIPVALAAWPAQAQVAAPPVRISVIDCSAEQFVAEGMAQARAQTGNWRAAFALLEDMGLKAADVSGAAQLGQIDLSNTDLLIVRKCTADTRKSLADNAAVLAEFVAGGGTIFQVTPTDQEQQVVDWLPEPLGAMITDLDFSVVHVEDPGHPLFTTPNLLSAAEIEQMCQQVGTPPPAPAGGGPAPPPPTSPVSWESFQAFRNAKLLVTDRQQGARVPEVPAAGLLEFEHGNGRILLSSIRLFGAYAGPGTDMTKDVVKWFVDNLVSYAHLVRGGQAPKVEPLTTFPW